MKRTLLIIAVAFFLFSCKEREINFNQLELRAGVYSEVNQPTPYTGIVKQYDENGALKEEAYLQEGKLDRFFTSYYENGQVWEERKLKDGKKEG